MLGKHRKKSSLFRKKSSLLVREQQCLGLMTPFIQIAAEKRKFLRLENIAVT